MSDLTHLAECIRHGDDPLALLTYAAANAWDDGWNARETFEPDDLTTGDNPYRPGGGL